jgi:O-antigen biosynthesis protein
MVLRVELYTIYFIKNMLSIITPTHNPKHLQRLYESIEAQTCRDFEWVVVPNNNADVSFLPKKDWIRIVPYTAESKLIGAIKNFAFMQGEGDWLLEMDHDDEMLPNCIEEIVKASSEVKCDFIYSDSLDIEPGYTSKTFPEYCGWKQYPFTYKTIPYNVNYTFLPTPQSVSRIWFAPNHIRAWRKNFYRTIGGHDVTLKALDDQDLMCRTYIAGKMHKIEKVLYAYYYHENNSFASQELNQWIQEYTLTLYEKYILQLMEKWCDVNGYYKVDINKRGTLRRGYLSIDLDSDTPSVPYDSVGLIVADDALQLYQFPVITMAKCWNLLASGGMLLSNTPSTEGRGAFQDPNHLSYWNINSFWYYTKSQFTQFTDSNIKFQATHTKNWYPSDFHKEHKIDYVMAHLTALKKGDERSWLPGIIEV